VPRGAKELHLSVRRASDELSSKLGRSPSVAEVAAHLDVPEDDVITGLSVGEARRVESIDPPTGDDGGLSSARQRATSTRDVGFVDIENQAVVEQLLETLPEREREIERLRFYEEMSQVDIAAIVGVSQMHVSRLLKRAFRELRGAYGELAGDEAAARGLVDFDDDDEDDHDGADIADEEE
jgi:RNA polymerase sigma-B factor